MNLRPTILRARSIAIRRGRDLLDFALPTACVACGATLDRAGALCDGCDSRLHDLQRMPACGLCASPLPDPNGPCGRCGDKGIPNLRAIARLSVFESTTREIIHAIKYGRRWPVIDVVAEWLRDKPRVRELIEEADVFVPIPLHWTRRFVRGFNQSDLLARALAGRHGPDVVQALRKTRRTKSQTAFHSRAGREKNVKDTFRLAKPSAITGRRVVLIDDVLTTGATLQAAARALRTARPTSISAIVIASANPLHSSLTVN